MTIPVVTVGLEMPFKELVARLARAPDERGAGPGGVWLALHLMLLGTAPTRS